ncbi:LysR family transcriptional regulator [Sphingomonas lenta]|uniref:LysR family transcriptional regulator n=1 Tax=Sphingomonas lenta TaxID=1141887 RepID=UPI001FE6601D|nr:LysR family transcriptional regulator [Sphingomonas lenta]
MNDPTHAPSAVRAQWTPAKQRIFLAALLETGSVSRAARAAGMSRSSAHRLRTRLAGTTFDRLWDQALAVHAQRMADPFAAQAEDGASPARPRGPSGAPAARP